jgi:predicted Rossmann fold flavoprotein
MKTIAVVGAGPAGLFASLHAAERARTVLLEKMPSAGKKLLLSGSGQCNITHSGETKSFLSRYGDAGRFLRGALYYLPPEKLLSFFGTRGIAFSREASGKIFPESRRAADILDLLTREAAKQGVDLVTRADVREAAVEGGRFRLRQNGGEIRIFDRLILAAGGCSWPGTGSDGSGFALAAQLGHSIVAPRPALTDVEIENFPLTGLAGVSLPRCGLTLRRQGRVIRRFEGDLLITHRGFSGPVILDASRGLEASDELVPDFSGLGEAAEERVIAWSSAHARRQLSSLFRILAAPQELCRALLAAANLPQSLPLAELSREKRKTLVGSFRDTGYRISRLGGFERARVTAGGVSREEINPKTMESRICPGLFFAGEIVDVDGDTGGFNLQAAFSTGALAGASC